MFDHFVPIQVKIIISLGCQVLLTNLNHRPKNISNYDMTNVYLNPHTFPENQIQTDDDNRSPTGD